MEILALDNNVNPVSVNVFFSKFSEFFENEKLAEQTSRFLKVLLRHPELETINKIANKVENGYSFEVNGACRTYTIVFELRNDVIVLKEVF